MKQKALTARQVRFVEAYLLSPIAKAAAKAAGFKHPEQQGYQLLHLPGYAHVQAAIAKAQAARAEKLELKAVDVVRELQRYAFAPAFGEDGAEPVDPLQLTVEPKDRLKALELLGKHLKLFTERHEVNVYGELTDEQLEARYQVLVAKGRAA